MTAMTAMTATTAMMVTLNATVTGTVTVSCYLVSLRFSKPLTLLVAEDFSLYRHVHRHEA
jgi:hypothetical protein